MKLSFKIYEIIVNFFYYNYLLIKQIFKLAIYEL